jgi:sialate O-acetylesterase
MGETFPFYFAQLSSYGPNQNSNEGSDWAELREAQTMALALPQTGMAVTIDIGDAKDIHPTNKQDVGKRLAAIALNQTYNTTIPWSGPMYQSMKVDGHQVVVSFSDTGNGLTANDKYQYVRGFELAGSDHVFYYAQARIENNTVIVSCREVENPVTVRYAWSNAPTDANLFNQEGFPAAPFRSDDWPGITVHGKFE